MTGPIGTNVSADTPALSVPGVQTGTVTVGTSAVALVNVPAFSTVVLQAPSTNSGAIHVGGSGVTTSTGLAVAAGGSVTLNGGMKGLLSLYAVAGAASQSITYVYVSG